MCDCNFNFAFDVQKKNDNKHTQPTGHNTLIDETSSFFSYKKAAKKMN
jgi:hypothetical protein